MNTQKEFGLIGRSISHSFSAKYFNEKFTRENIAARYDLYPLSTINLFPELIHSHTALAGLNVTIPYKVEVIPFLDALSEEAEAIGAVNVIKITRNSGHVFLKGYNTDAFGFYEAIKKVLKEADCKTDIRPQTALILGTGGASRAVVWSMQKLGFTTQLVGRRHRDNCLSYEELTPDLVSEASVIVNCTPLGTSPNVDEAAPFPYQYLHKGQVAFDLVYNPSETLFMRICAAHGCIVSNGLEMLRLQAVGAWQIWSDNQVDNQVAGE